MQFAVNVNVTLTVSAQDIRLNTTSGGFEEKLSEVSPHQPATFAVGNSYGSGGMHSIMVCKGIKIIPQYIPLIMHATFIANIHPSYSQ